MHSVEPLVTVNYIKTLSVAQQCFYCKFMSPAECKLHVPVFERSHMPTNLHSFHTLHINAASKQMTAPFFMPIFRRTVWLNSS
jgi:hypothetical protein